MYPSANREKASQNWDYDLFSDRRLSGCKTSALLTLRGNGLTIHTGH